MSFADAQAALEGAMAQDFGGDTPAAPAPVAPVEQAPVPSATPEGSPAPEQPGQLRDEFGRFTTPQPATPEQTVDSTDSVWDGTPINPDTLPDELKPLAKQLEAAFTPKLQEAAALRKQLEQMGGLDTVRQATELFTALQDPGYLQEFHGELTRALEAQGLSPAQARTEAARQIEERTAPTQSVSDALARLKDDPELAPVAETLSSLEQRLASFEQQQHAREEAEQLAAQQMALAGHIQRQEIAIRQANPNYTQDDVDAVYELSAFFDGDLMQAQQRYEQIMSRRLEAYVAQKQSPSPASAPVSGTGTSEVPVPVTDLQQAYRAALGHLAEQGIDTLA